VAGKALLEFQDFQEFIMKNTPHAEVFPARESFISNIDSDSPPMLVRGITHF